nr:hypothetical protein [Klebsiella pneumoniae]UVX22438.1 hypothetical protein [Escherichia coli]
MRITSAELTGSLFPDTCGSWCAAWQPTRQSVTMTAIIIFMIKISKEVMKKT